VQLEDIVGIGTIPVAGYLLAAQGAQTIAAGSIGADVVAAGAKTLANSGTHGVITAIYGGTFPVTETTTSLITNFATIYVDAAPTYSGAGGDITNGPYSIFVDAGESRFDGDIGDATNRVPVVYATDVNVGNDVLLSDGAVTKTPASAAATGTTGTIAWDADYIYVCTATDTWKRVAIATW
jgi:hypothetical protein